MVHVWARQYFPPTCFISEAALWVAFGRVPEFHHWGGVEDSRTSAKRIIESGNGSELEWGFSEEEFQSLGISIDFNRYSDARASSNYQTGDEEREFINSFFSKLRASEKMTEKEAAEFMSDVATEIAKREKNAEELDWACDQEFDLFSHVDQARAAVFQALASGKIVAKGIEGGTTYENEAQWTEVTSREWTLQQLDWDENCLAVRKRVIRWLQVSCEDLLKVFPRPMLEPRFGQASIYGEVAFLDDESDVGIKLADTRRGRGRPAHGDGIVREGVQRIFGPRIRRGEFHEKKEALVAEIMEFTEAAYQKPISRSTAQEYIKALLQSVPENMPLIVAGK